MKVGILLSGCGVYDGTEIQESIYALLALEEIGAETLFFAPNVDQLHVVNHLTGEEINQKRNVLVESARIARGDIEDLANISDTDIDALVIPGGFGTAKNHTNWALHGPESEINTDVKRIINEMVNAKKPIVALCMAPTTVAKALQDSKFSAHLTVGTTLESSPYDIAAISEGILKTGAQPEMKTVKEICVDENLKIITAPCYMMNASSLVVRENVKTAIEAMSKLI